MSEISVEQALKIAIDEHQSGHFQRAQELYVMILQRDPGNVDAIHLLGVLANQGKKPEMAVELIERAVAARPTEPIFRYNFSDCLYKVGRKEDAVNELKEAVRISPDYYEAWNNLSQILVELQRFPEAVEAANEAYELADDPAIPLNNLGNAYRGLGQMDKAKECYEEAVAERDDLPELLSNLAIICSLEGDFDRSIKLLRRCIEVSPAFADAYNNLGTIYLRRGQLEESAEMLQMALKIKPDYVDAINNLAVVLRESGRPEEAIAAYDKALEYQPDSAQILVNLSTALRDMGQIERSTEMTRKAIALDPDCAAAYFSLSSNYQNLNQLDEAIENGLKAFELEPGNPAASCSLGYKLIERGDVEEGIEYIRKSLEISLDPTAFSSSLLAANYVPDFSPEEVTNMHRDWGVLVGENSEVRPHEFANKKDPDKRLKIGYISPDFRMHSVYFFAEPFLANHDKSEHEIIAYSALMRPDHKTLTAKVYMDGWREVVGMGGRELVDLIRADEIDILVELAGHTAGNSLTQLIEKAAPVVISGIGYPCTTGLPTVDYRLTDSFCDPVGNEQYNTETLLRLDPSFWCYRPPQEAPPVSDSPAARNGYVTFASVNTFSKVSPMVQEVWAKLLAAVPNSRLILQSSGTGSKTACEKIRSRFESFGVNPDRLILKGHSPFNTFMAEFSEVDIVLDPFPFNGGTTTCHNLWMGCPTLTLAGVRHPGRMGVSIMNNVGLPEFVANSVEEYVQIGAKFASDIPRLVELRKTLRDRMEASPLRDEVGYTRRLEAAYRSVWQSYCAQ